MNRLRRLLLALLAVVLALPAMAEPVPLSRLNAYLNGFATARAKFTQINTDGSVSTGTLYLARPGRARFEYDPPSPALVVAGSGQVAVFDRKSNVPPEQFALDRTPLSIILAPRVDLARPGVVERHVSDGSTTAVVARDPERPEFGSLMMVFSDNPVALRQWVIADEAGGETTVILGEMRTGLALDDGLFSIAREMARLPAQLNR